MDKKQFIPKDYDIQTMLEDIVDDQISTPDIDLWPAIVANLDARDFQTDRQGENKAMNTFKFSLPRASVAMSLVLAVVMVLMFATPQGRAFAQSIIEFFAPTAETSFPLEDNQIPSDISDSTAPTAEAPASLISVTEAEAQLGIVIAELPVVPDGFEYLGVRLYGEIVSIEYVAQGGGGNLIIRQSLTSFYDEAGGGWDQVFADAIVPVMVGDVEGAFVQGMFVVYPNDTEATWNPDAAINRLRWSEGRVWYEIAKYGELQTIEYLDQAGLIKLAESLEK